MSPSLSRCLRSSAIATVLLTSLSWQPGVPAESIGEQRITSATGVTRIAGRQVLIEVLVAASSSTDARAGAEQALIERGARPVDQIPIQDFTTLFGDDTAWPQFADAPRKKQSVVQYYNPANDPTDGGGLTALQNAQQTWSSVQSSVFALDLGGVTSRCPSLLFECPLGPDSNPFDGFNDVGWVQIQGSTEEFQILGVAAVAEDGDSNIIEADVALVPSPGPWFTDGRDFDVETLMLHELGHVAGLGHTTDPGAVLFPFYSGVKRALTQSEINGIEYLYPRASHPHPDQPLPPPPPIDAIPLAFIGDPAPEGAPLRTVLDAYDMNDSGDLLFADELYELGPLPTRLLRATATGTRQLATAGQAAAGGGTLFVGPFSAAINSDGTSAFDFVDDDFLAGIYRAPAGAGSIEAVVGPGTPAPSDQTYLEGFDADINDGGTIAFTGITETGSGAYAASADGAIATVAAPGDVSSAGALDNASNPAINGAGDVAFDGHRADADCLKFRQGRCVGDVYVRRAGTDVAQLIVGQDQPTPDGSSIMRAAYGPVINDPGDVLFGADLVPARVQRFAVDKGLFMYSGGSIRKVIRPGDALPHGGSMVRQSTRAQGQPDWTMNNRGDVAMSLTLNARTSGSDGIGVTGVYLERAGKLRLVARAGTYVRGLGTIRFIGSLFELIDAPGFFDSVNGTVALNDTGDVVFPATLTDGRVVLLRTSTAAGPK